MDGVQRGVDVYNGVYRGMWVYIWMVYKGVWMYIMGCTDGCGSIYGGGVQKDVGVYREGDYIKGCGYIESVVVERVWVWGR